MIFKILAVYGSEERNFEFHEELFHVDKSNYLWIMEQLQLFNAITYRKIKLNP